MYPTTFTCENCGISFERKLYKNSKKPRFCSNRCNGQFTQRHKRLPRHTLSCNVCGTEFVVHANRLRNARYCSIACRAIASAAKHPRFPLNTSIRKKVYDKTQGKCWYCGEELTSIWHADHVLPRVLGGTNELSNIVPTCPKCNIDKGTLTLEEFRTKNNTDQFWFEKP